MNNHNDSGSGKSLSPIALSLWLGVAHESILLNGGCVFVDVFVVA